MLNGRGLAIWTNSGAHVTARGRIIFNFPHRETFICGGNSDFHLTRGIQMPSFGSVWTCLEVMFFRGGSFHLGILLRVRAWPCVLQC